MNRFFSHFARGTEKQAARAHTFVIAVALIVIWAATGPLFNYSDTWQLVINTGTTIVTFLMVFLIQHCQFASNRDPLFASNRPPKQSGKVPYASVETARGCILPPSRA
jgi:low affinity Fe/Cu permease